MSNILMANCTHVRNLRQGMAIVSNILLANCTNVKNLHQGIAIV